jgi:DNA-binding IclR family transcriptional regulator
MRIQELPTDYVLVLHQIEEDGAEDYNNLVETLRFERSRLAHIVRSLQHKGLVSFRGDGEHGFWITLSAKGRRFMEYTWPEKRGGLQLGF